jgi:hypothetical protein
MVEMIHGGDFLIRDSFSQQHNEMVAEDRVVDNKYLGTKGFLFWG